MDGAYRCVLLYIYMHQDRLIGVLLRPSLFSFSVTSVMALLVLGTANWPYVARRVFFYDYFFGPDGLVSAIQDSPDSASALLDTLFSKSFSYNLAILLGAIVAGMVVFFVLQLLSRLARNASGVYEDLHAIDSVPKRMVEHELARRIFIRIVIAFVWVAYAFVTLKVIIPFCVFTAEVGLKALWGLDGILFLLFGFAVFLLCLHLHVILARLFVLKPRVFGSETATLG